MAFMTIDTDDKKLNGWEVIDDLKRIKDYHNNDYITISIIVIILSYWSIMSKEWFALFTFLVVFFLFSFIYHDIKSLVKQEIKKIESEMNDLE